MHRARDTTRWDIQGLRAFAVLAVVVYHLWPAAVPGGFVGVDVFFVISGYLITGHLLREQLGAGRIRLAQFWSRRAKRLLPSAFIVIAATGAAVILAVPGALWGQYGRELIASTVYVQNWRLAASAVDYLAADEQPSPFQHFWSLSVEEQFYIALPLLLIAASLLGRGRSGSRGLDQGRGLGRGRSGSRGRARPVVTARVLLGTVVAVSLAWSVVQTATNPGVAYFSTATRAWEFALGGLAATVTLPAIRGSRALLVRTVGAGTGALGLLVSLAVVTPDIPFPGAVAILPVASAALVVLFGGGTVFESLGSLRPVRFTGRISYALYLWHWPAIVVLPFVLGHPTTWPERVGILVASYALAAVTTVHVEEPLRFSDVVRRLRPRGAAYYGLVATLVVVALGVSTLSVARTQEVQAAAAAQQLTEEKVSCFGAAARISSPDPCVDPDLAETLVPAPAAAKADDPNRGECWTGRFRPCVLGQETGWSKRLIVIGDSHSNTFLAAYEKTARENHWRIDLAGVGGCYLTTAEQAAPSDAARRGCNRWKQQAIAYVRAHRADADALVVVHSTTQMPVEAPAGPERDDATRAGLVDAWTQAAGTELPVIAIRDNPVPRRDVIACVSAMAAPTDGTCDNPRSAALGQTDSSAEAVADFTAAGGRARLVDLSGYYCTDTVCPAVIGGVLVYRDTSHVTGTWAMSLQPYLAQQVRAALRAFDTGP